MDILKTIDKVIMVFMIATSDGYDWKTKEGYCVLQSDMEQIIGLLRYENQESVKKNCNGVLIFKMERECNYFHSRGVKFRFYFSTQKEKNTLFPENSEKEICVKVVIEHISPLPVEQIDRLIKEIKEK